MTNPTWFCGTIWKHLCNWTLEQIAAWFKQHHAKEGVVGLEISPTSGKEHYQFKIHLDRGETLDGWKALIGPMGHIEIAVDKNFSGYEEKDGNFIKWPESPLEEFRNLELCGWQKDALKLLKEQNNRKILCVYDAVGSAGKSTFSKYLEINGIADVCPVVSDEFNDYTGYCIKYQKSGYVFDIPKATSIKKRCAMWSGIEQIKNGCLYEKRYHPEKVWIKPPKIIVFTNETLPYEMLSRDRWTELDVADYSDTPQPEP